jgi:Glucose / Sorbosone dehydrogenase
MLLQIAIFHWRHFVKRFTLPIVVAVLFATIAVVAIAFGQQQPAVALWETENGPQGGDEVNVILPGKNYGWPVVSYGRDYDGSKIGERPWRENMEAPIVFWVPSITTSGMTFYTGDRFPTWKGNLFVGSMTVGRIHWSSGANRF